MKRVSGYQTTDGKIFPNDQKQQAREHQAALNVVASLTVIGNRIDTDASLFIDDFGCNAILSGEAFAAFVLANAEDIKKALAGKAVEAPVEPAGDEAPATPEAPADGVDALVAELGGAAA